MDMYQFFPTPRDLAKRVWNKRKNRHPNRVLEPSAGNGDLLLGMPGAEDDYSYNSRRRLFEHIDCCEIDISHHARLRELGVKIVGYDFMAMQSGSIYDLIILNPPFAVGDRHVLKAYDMLWDGEVLAILNAETIRNPHTAERRRLARLIEEHGDVEYVQGAFEVEEAERKTSVEIAIVHLIKTVEAGSFVTANLLRNLEKDSTTGETLAKGYKAPQELAIPTNEIENKVRVFQAAVQASHDAAMSQAQASFYVRLLGDSMRSRMGPISDRGGAPTVEFVRKALAESYDDLKDRAWSSVIESADVTSKLSSKAQDRVRNEFASIKQLDFTVGNIYGFLVGVCESQGRVQMDMLCDIFDVITRYHTDNATYYRGWKSNDRHRYSIGRRIKYTRFVIPGESCDGWQRSMPYRMHGLLSDLDKAFAMLDGKAAPELSLTKVCEDNFAALKQGARVKSSYFDVRFYPGVGTIHFFPTNHKLIDRLNRFVGQQRGWLPQENDKTRAAGFWRQYDEADKLDKQVRKAVSQRFPNRGYTLDPFRRLDEENENPESEKMRLIDEALQSVHEANGIKVDFHLESAAGKGSVGASQSQLLLLTAA